MVFLLLFALDGFLQKRDIWQFKSRVLYKYSFQSDSTNSATKRIVLSELFIGDTMALFQTRKKTVRDSTIFQSGHSGRITIYVGEINPLNFQILQGKTQLTTFESLNGLSLELNNELYCYKEKAELPWQLTSDTMVIHDISCQKALLQWEGRNWIVWFAPDIPIPHGPYKFEGLPGLIVRAYDTKNFFHFDLQSLQLDKELGVPMKIRPDLSVIQTTKKGFYAMRRNLRDNMYEMGVAAGQKPREKTKKFAAILQRTDNNHIEKY